MIEPGYRYCKLDKIHYYSVVNTGESSLYFNQWLWHFLKFKQTKNINLIPYHCADSQYDYSKILTRYKGFSAKVIAGHISRKIENHRRLLKA